MVNWHKFFTSILDTISDGVFISDAVGTTLYVNQMYADLVGVPARELRGKNVRDLVSEGLFDLALNPEVVRTGKPATYMQKLKDGKNVVISGAPVFDDKGRVCLVVTFVRDETRLAELNEQTGEQRRLIKEINDKLAFVAQSQGRDLEPVFASSAMQSVALELKRYASTDATVLIMGETGVGKDVFARLTHRWSRRKDKILLKVDCGGISETLTESEIFGYVPGAFTGASSKGKPGYFEIADGSTIFLDEVGELPLSMQTRLLRVLQDNEIVRVGSSQPRKVDVRIIAATNRDLEECVEAGTFRRDLFYRLNVGTVRIPPLRERPEDVRVLAELFLRQYTTKYRKKLAFMDITLDMLARYRWPGNVRELQNCLTRALAFCENGLIFAENIQLGPDTLPGDIARPERGKLSCPPARADNRQPHSEASETAEPPAVQPAPAGNGEQPPAAEDAPPRLNARLARLLPRLVELGSISRQEYQDMAGKDISMRTAQYDLQILVRLGLVRREGRGPAQRYIVLPAARGFRA